MCGEVFRARNSKSAVFSSFCLSCCELRRSYQRSMRHCDCVLMYGGCVVVQRRTTNSWYPAFGRRQAQATCQCSLLFLKTDNTCTNKIRSRDSIISVLTWPQTGWPKNVVQFLAGTRDFCLFLSVHADCVSHPASYWTATADSFSGGKAARTWGWPLTSAKVKNTWNCTWSHPYAFMACFLITNSSSFIDKMFRSFTELFFRRR